MKGFVRHCSLQTQVDTIPPEPDQVEFPLDDRDKTLAVDSIPVTEDASASQLSAAVIIHSPVGKDPMDLKEEKPFGLCICLDK